MPYKINFFIVQPKMFLRRTFSIVMQMRRNYMDVGGKKILIFATQRDNFLSYF